MDSPNRSQPSWGCCLMHDNLRPPALRSALDAIIPHFIQSKITADAIFKEGNNIWVATGNLYNAPRSILSRLDNIIGDIIVEGEGQQVLCLFFVWNVEIQANVACSRFWILDTLGSNSLWAVCHNSLFSKNRTKGFRISLVNFNSNSSNIKSLT